MECADGGCPDDLFCHTSECCEFPGVCIDADAAPCGGIVGTKCPAGEACVVDACIGDGDGLCVPQDVFEGICSQSTTCWSGCPKP